jgi:putative tricarboxylic transport membrane protein
MDIGEARSLHGRKREAVMKPKRFLNKDIVSGIGLILFGMFVILKARDFESAAERFRGVSPALFPTVLSVVMILLSLIVVLKALRKSSNWKFSFDLRKTNSYIAAGFVAITALYAYTLEFLGFFLATFFYTLLFIIWMKGASPIKATVIAFVSVGVIYFVFHALMFVPFPRGEIMELFGL